MARKIAAEDAARYAIAVCHPDGTRGFLTGPDADVQTYATQSEAERAMRRLLKDDSYTWSHPLEVCIYPERREK